jgi:hypothetical protein
LRRSSLPASGRAGEVAPDPFNALQFVGDPGAAAREAFRVLAPRGCLAVAGFAEPARNESSALHLALEPLRAARGGRHGGR